MVTITLDGKLPRPLLLVELASAPPELQDFFGAYWDLVEWHPSGISRWANPVAAIGVGDWGRDASAAAGAGGVATIEGANCALCGGALTLTSRTAFDQAQRDESTKCRDCTANFDGRVAKVGSPEALARRETRADQRRVLEVERRDQATLAARRTEAISTRYGTPRSDGAPGLHKTTVTQLVTLLALVRHHMRDGITVALDDVEKDDPLLAAYSQFEYFKDVLDSRLLQVHASTPAKAFVWKADTGEEAATFDDSWYVTRLRLYRDTGEEPAVSASWMGVEVVDLLNIDLLDRTSQGELVLLARDLLAEEGMHYLEYQLRRYSLPAIPERHRSRFRATMQRAADHLTLGNIYQLAWSAGSAATNLYQGVYTSKEKASTHALNKFEARLMEVLEDPSRLLDPYSLIDQVVLSSMTQVLFHEVLGLPIISTSLDDIRAQLPEPRDVVLRTLCLEEIPTAEEVTKAQLELFAADQETVAKALESLESNPLPICVFGCAHDRANRHALGLLARWRRLSINVGQDAATTALIEFLPIVNYRDADRPERVGDLLVMAINERTTSGV